MACALIQAPPLLSIWYCIITTLLHITISCRQLSAHRQLLQLPWQQLPAELHTQLVMVWLSLTLLPVFVLCTCICWQRTGPLMNSYRQLCISGGTWWRVVARCVPLPPLLHVVMATLLVTARSMVFARVLANGFLSSKHMWTNDISQVLHALSSTFPDRICNSTGNITSSLQHHHLRLMPVPVTPEFLHLIFAVVSLAVGYSVKSLWHCSRPLAVVFSLNLAVNSAQLVSAPSGLSTLLNAHMYGPELLQLPTHLLLDTSTTCTLHFLSTLLVAVSGSSLYLLGYQRLWLFQQTNADTSSRSAKGWSPRYTSLPHCAALCMLLAVGVANAPLLYDISVLYRRSKQLALLVVLASSLLQLALWLMLWLLLVVRPHCGFSIQLAIRQSRADLSEEVTHLRLKVDKREKQDEQILVDCPEGIFIVDDSNSTKLIFSAIARQKMINMTTKPLKSSLKKPILKARTHVESIYDICEERRYVEPPGIRAQNSAEISNFGKNMQEKSAANDKSFPIVMFASPEPEKSLRIPPYPAVNNRREFRECDSEAGQPLLPLRPRALRPPPEQIYTSRLHFPAQPARLRRTCSQALQPPVIPTSFVQRSLSFRHQPKRSCVEPRVKFDLNVAEYEDHSGRVSLKNDQHLHTTRVGDIVLPASVHQAQRKDVFQAEFGGSRCNELTGHEQMTQHSGTTTETLIKSSRISFSGFQRPQCEDDLGSLLKTFKTQPPQTPDRDSANFSMSLSGGSDSGCS